VEVKGGKGMDTHRIDYVLTLAQGRRIELSFAFEAGSFALVPAARAIWPAWTALATKQCPHCPLEAGASPRCPLAASLVDIVEATNDVVSHTPLHAEVVTADRTVGVDTTAAGALRSLLGLVIPTSGCPHAAFFRPMARFHLPFSTRGETLYRVTSMYCLAQHLRAERGQDASRDLAPLTHIYENLNLLNRHMADRLRLSCRQDSSINALTLLDCFAQMLPMQLEAPLDELAPLFEAYLK
jgi:hypothetical protein